MDANSLKWKQFLLDTQRYKKSDKIMVFAYPDSTLTDYTRIEVRKLFHKGLGSPVIRISNKEFEYWERYKMRNEKITKIQELLK